MNLGVFQVTEKFVSKEECLLTWLFLVCAWKKDVEKEESYTMREKSKDGIMINVKNREDGGREESRFPFLLKEKGTEAYHVQRV